MKKILLFTSIILLFNSCALILDFQDLPKPIGNYIIGTDVFDWDEKALKEGKRAPKQQTLF